MEAFSGYKDTITEKDDIEECVVYMAVLSLENH